MIPEHSFPFGVARLGTPPSTPVSGPAAAFVLGVYPSAVHARWTVDGEAKGGALAVAPEPVSFWEGEGARDVVDRIARCLPESAGRIAPAPGANGRSGKVLRRYYLEPLKLQRDRCWITDLDDGYYLPSERPNVDPAKRMQRSALSAYEEFRTKRRRALPAADLPDRPRPIRPSHARRSALEDEFHRSGATCVIALGAEPAEFVTGRADALKRQGYGTAVPITVWGKRVALLCLCHPRQAGGLGRHDVEWKAAHADWMERVRAAGGLAEILRYVR